MTDTGSKTQACTSGSETSERCNYYADGTDYRCTNHVGHDGAHRSKAAARIGVAGPEFWTCRCPDCVSR